MTSIKVASWNLARGLSDPDKVESIYGSIKELDADIIFLPEAYDKHHDPTTEDEFLEKARRELGYTAQLLVKYEDEEEHPSGEQYILGLGRAASGVSFSETRFSTRNAISADFELEGRPVTATGAHFDDRHEELRLGMTDSYLSAKEDSNSEQILVGDLNAMHGDSWQAKLLSVGRERGIVDRALSSSGADKFIGKFDELVSKLKPGKTPASRARSLLTRLVGMASGDVMSRLQGAGFIDADPRREPTMMMGFGKFAVKAVQLDHIMSRGNLVVNEFTNTHSPDSDHRIVSAKIEMANDILVEY